MSRCIYFGGVLLWTLWLEPGFYIENTALKMGLVRLIIFVITKHYTLAAAVNVAFSVMLAHFCLEQVEPEAVTLAWKVDTFC